MQVLDRTGVGTLWSICKEKFALTGHTHNYAGSGSPGGSANSAIGVVDYNNTDKTIQIGYSGAGISGDDIKYIAGYTFGGGDVDAKIKDVSKEDLQSWLGLGSLLCNFNFVRQIAECENGRINFLLVSNDADLDLNDFQNYEDGTILLLCGYDVSTNITIYNSTHDWRLNRSAMDVSSRWNYRGWLTLITIRFGEVIVYYTV